MRRFIAPLGLLALVGAGAGVWWLMRHDLRLAVYAAAALLGLVLVSAVVAFLRGHRAWSLGLLGLLVAVGALGAGYGWNLNAKIDQIPRIDDSVIGKGPRPPKQNTKALNILLLGADDPKPDPAKPTVAELLADGTWDPGAYRSDSMMVLHISADRRTASVVSIPRDSYVPIYDGEGSVRSENKINAAFSYYGPFGTWRTVENLIGLRIDHLAMIDFEGFRELTTALGGVDVYVPSTVSDSKRKRVWEQGWHHIEGQEALDYVRMRYGLTNGDFDRVRRQQNFLRAVLTKLVDDGTIGDPLKVQATVESIVPYLTVDSSWTTSDIRSLTLGLRNLRPAHISYATLPLARYESIPNVGDANIIDEARARELWQAVADESVDDYLRRYPEDSLGSPEKVS